MQIEETRRHGLGNETSFKLSEILKKKKEEKLNERMMKVKNDTKEKKKRTEEEDEEKGGRRIRKEELTAMAPEAWSTGIERHSSLSRSSVMHTRPYTTVTRKVLKIEMTYL